jgi:hypothetical protein
MKTETIVILNPDTVPVHDIASIHRRMTDAEYESLKIDIRENGQTVPVILYRGKIVDGRHRQKALIDIGTNHMKCIELPNNMSINEVKNKVIGTEMRRADNVAQKSIRALKWMDEEFGRTQQEAAIKFGIDQRGVSEAKTLLNNAGLITVDKLYNDGYLILGNKKYTTIRKILAYLKPKIETKYEGYEIDEITRRVLDDLNRMHMDGNMVGIVMIEALAGKLRVQGVE